MLIKETLRRLKVLREHFASVPPRFINMGSWGQTSQIVNRRKPVRLKPECGTHACLLGWGTQIPEFAELGLKLVRSPYAPLGARALAVEFESRHGTTAGANFFGIPYLDAHGLFVMTESINPVSQKATALRRLDRLIAKYEAKVQ